MEWGYDSKMLRKLNTIHFLEISKYDITNFSLCSTNNSEIPVEKMPRVLKKFLCLSKYFSSLQKNINGYELMYKTQFPNFHWFYLLQYTFLMFVASKYRMHTFCSYTGEQIFSPCHKLLSFPSGLTFSGYDQEYKYPKTT